MCFTISCYAIELQYNFRQDFLAVEESGTSDVEDTAWSMEEEWLVGQAAPLNLLSSRCGAQTLHLAPGDLVSALLDRGKFTVSSVPFSSRTATGNDLKFKKN